MPTFDANSVDAIVTDPPYGLSFMGKDWDRGVPGVAFWEAALRVMKPGAFLLSFGGTRTFHRLICAIEDAGFEIRDCMMWLYGSGFPKSHNLHGEYEGWGTALKPAWEPIIVARKPLEGTVAQNVQKWGCGAMNIDGSRIGTDRRFNDPASSLGNGINMSGGRAQDIDGHFVTGRWPANVILDEEAGAMLDGQSGVLKSGDLTGQKTKSSFLADVSKGDPQFWKGDSGGASRFFYCAKASKRERGEENNHPTVKPLLLLSYLAKLVTPSNGLILDPFIGSGSTAVAAIQNGFRFIGIEKEPKYAEIARARIEATERPLVAA